MTDSLLQGVTDEGNQSPTLRVQGDASGHGLFKPFQELADGWHGNMIVLHQQSNESADYLSRSCAMRVDDISEMRRVLEIFFKL